MVKQNLSLVVNPYQSPKETSRDINSDDGEKGLFSAIALPVLGLTPMTIYFDIINYLDDSECTHSYLTKFIMDLF
jgi:hypothetical protein